VRLPQRVADSGLDTHLAGDRFPDAFDKAGFDGIAHGDCLLECNQFFAAHVIAQFLPR
jgi:hypothetical protein